MLHKVPSEKKSNIFPKFVVMTSVKYLTDQITGITVLDGNTFFRDNEIFSFQKL